MCSSGSPRSTARATGRSTTSTSTPTARADGPQGRTRRDMTDEPERLLEESRPHRPRRLARRERRVELLGAAALLATAGALAATAGATRSPGVGLIVLYAVLYAGASRVRLYV